MNQIEQDTLRFNQWYQDIETHFVVSYPQNGELRYLCDRLDNQGEPVYSWYNLKEAFSAHFPQWAINKLQMQFDFQPKHILDPFVGGGTSVISLAMLGLNANGVEYNPFIVWAAQVKSSWPKLDISDISKTISKIKFNIPKGTRFKWPEISTIHNTKYFRRNDIRMFLYVLQQIQELQCKELTKDFLRLGVAAAIDDVSNLMKDGRALRYVQKPHRPTAHQALSNRWETNLLKLQQILSKPNIKPLVPKILRGSAIDLTNLLKSNGNSPNERLEDSHYDLVIYSPPYLNNFDYSEIYKLELWLLGFIQNYEQWSDLRKGTLRSHHSIKFDVTNCLSTDPLTHKIYNYLSEMGQSACLSGYAKVNMPSTILGYFDDMYLALKEQYRVLKPGGFLVYLVANSQHKDLPIATDLIIGEVARKIGFKPLDLMVLRERNGRTKTQHFLRESVVFLRKSL